MLIPITYIEAFVHEIYSYFNNSVSEKYWGITMTWLKWQSFYGTWNIQTLTVGFASKSETRFIRHKIASLSETALLLLQNLHFLAKRATESLMLYVTPVNCLVQPLLKAGSVCLSRLLRDLPRWVMNVSKDGDSSTSPGNQLQMH